MQEQLYTPAQNTESVETSLGVPAKSGKRGAKRGRPKKRAIDFFDTSRATLVDQSADEIDAAHALLRLTQQSVRPTFKGCQGPDEPEL